jgi:hypothetical protein
VEFGNYLKNPTTSPNFGGLDSGQFGQNLEIIAGNQRLCRIPANKIPANWPEFD